MLHLSNTVYEEWTQIIRTLVLRPTIRIPMLLIDWLIDVAWRGLDLFFSILGKPFNFTVLFYFMLETNAVHVDRPGEAQCFREVTISKVRIVWCRKGARRVWVHSSHSKPVPFQKHFFSFFFPFQSCPFMNIALNFAMSVFMDVDYRTARWVNGFLPIVIDAYVLSTRGDVSLSSSFYPSVFETVMAAACNTLCVVYVFFCVSICLGSNLPSHDDNSLDHEGSSGLDTKVGAVPKVFINAAFWLISTRY